MAFQVASCPRCQKPQLTTATKTFGCKYCGKVSDMATIKVHFSTSSHGEALRFLYRLQPSYG